MKPWLRPRRWAVFISGRGSNLQALLDQVARQDIAVVYSSKSSAMGLLRAKRSGIPSHVLAKKIDWPKVTESLRQSGVTDIFLLGFMKLVPQEFVNQWEGHLFNVHPSLLPLYPGLHAFEKSYQDRAPMGVTVHHVTEEMDAGPRCLQKAFLTADGQNKISQDRAGLYLSWTEQRLVREWGARWK